MQRTCNNACKALVVVSWSEKLAALYVSHYHAPNMWLAIGLSLCECHANSKLGGVSFPCPRFKPSMTARLLLQYVRRVGGYPYFHIYELLHVSRLHPAMISDSYTEGRP